MNQLWIERAKCLAVLCLLLSFYGVTRPLNHSESYDSINYALFAENFPLGEAPDSRNILFHALNRVTFLGAQACGFDVGTLELLSGISILAGALSVILFAQMMKRRFEVSPFAAWAGAGFLGLTYGYWRYAGAAEVYIPSIFLILCSVELIFKSLSQRRRGLESVVAAGTLSGLAVLYYQPNVIVLFVAAAVLFCSKSRGFYFIAYSLAGALIVVAGLAWSYHSIEGGVPSPQQFVNFVTSRNSEFRERPSIGIALVKFVLAFGHDVFSAHWTRTIDPVRTFLDPWIPGCVYNFNVVADAGKGIQFLTMIAAGLFLPLLILLARLLGFAAASWKLAQVKRRTLFLFLWMLSVGGVVGTIDPGSFEAWIPLLVPFSALLTVFVIEPCCRLGKRKSILAVLAMLMAYNFFGGMLIWRNTAGDQFLNKTAWLRTELGEGDTVLLNLFDFRMIDYLQYYSQARVVHLWGDDQVTLFRSHPDIHSVSLDDFVGDCKSGDFRLFVMDDLLSPDPDIRQCRDGEVKFAAAQKLADRLRAEGRAILMDANEFGEVYQIRFGDE